MSFFTLFIWILTVKSDLCAAHSLQTLISPLQTLGELPPPRHQILLKKKFNLNFVPERTVPDGIKDRVNDGVEYANPI